MKRRRHQRRLFSHSLRRMKRQASGEELELLKLTIADNTIRELVYTQTMETLAKQSSQHAMTVFRSSDGAPIVDNLLKLLDWFTNNGPAIIEIIKLISGLFGGVAQATSIVEEAAAENAPVSVQVVSVTPSSEAGQRRA